MRGQQIRHVCAAVVLLLAATPALGATSSDDFRSWTEKQLPRLEQRYGVPGAAVAIVEGGHVTSARGYGFADLVARRPVTNNTVFQVASISKSVTAWGVMKLVERRLVDLDTPVDRYLKRWHLPASPYNDQVTVRRVLSHTAGLSLHGYAGNDPDRPLPTLVQSLEGHNSSGIPVRVVEKPGKRWSYSGGGYAVLQLLIEDVTGKPFADYMRTTILRPLGMNHSSYRWDVSLRSSTARAYSQTPDVLPNYLYPEQAPAGLYATGPDLARFAAAVASSDGAGVLTRASVQTILKPEPATGGALGEYGFGVATEGLAHGDRLVQHTGGNRGWSAIWLALPAKRAGMVILTNSNTGALLYTDTSCQWARSTTGDSPRACTALSGIRSFVAAATTVAAAAIVGYLSYFALGVRKRRRTFRRPSGRRWLRLAAFPLCAVAWIAFWNTSIVTASVGLGFVPSLVFPSVFRWASLVVVAGTVALAATTFFPESNAGPPASRTRRLVIAAAVSGLWIAFLYTDGASRLIFHLAGPRPATQLSASMGFVVTAVVVGVCFAVCLLYRRRHVPPASRDEALSSVNA